LLIGNVWSGENHPVRTKPKIQIKTIHFRQAELPFTIRKVPPVTAVIPDNW
jgi:hypothetical protein